MEAEYGVYFLANYQGAPLARSLLAPFTEVKAEKEDVEATAGVEEKEADACPKLPLPALPLAAFGAAGCSSAQECEILVDASWQQTTAIASAPLRKEILANDSLQQTTAIASAPLRKEILANDSLQQTTAIASAALRTEDDEHALLSQSAPSSSSRSKALHLSDGVDSNSDPDQEAVLAASVQQESRSREAQQSGHVTPRKAASASRDAALEASPSPPGGEAPLPQMPPATALPPMPSAATSLSSAPLRAGGGGGGANSGSNAPAQQKQEERRLSSVRLSDADRQVCASLDRFFSDEKLWQLVEKEVSSSSKLRLALAELPGALGSKEQAFRVQVPKPYPGVQYRRSKNLEDRYPRYAKHGQTVAGYVEGAGGGEWLRISENVFLPMQVGNIDIMRPISAEERRQALEAERAAKAAGRSNAAQSTSSSAFAVAPSGGGGRSGDGTLLFPTAALSVDTEDGSTVTSRLSTLQPLPESISKAPLNDPDALNDFYSKNPINALSDTPRACPAVAPSQLPSMFNLPSDGDRRGDCRN
eukprot:TRINITY_DN5855_c0_g1_i1.p1 TRINITY_DN5855_c0_g1~~TRINITY_DN5855_c0_g1_i1.p1  ORF type:complete len:533 (-),score=121.53 TRINITY_DN5855_c0_g1_i1:2-1600(-)